MSADDFAIFVRDETIVEDAQALVSPHANEFVRRIEAIGHGDEETVIDAREIAQIEDVVEFRRGRRQIANDSLIEFHCRFGYRLA